MKSLDIIIWSAESPQLLPLLINHLILYMKPSFLRRLCFCACDVAYAKQCTRLQRSVDRPTGPLLPEKLRYCMPASSSAHHISAALIGKPNAPSIDRDDRHRCGDMLVLMRHPSNRTTLKVPTNFFFRPESAHAVTATGYSKSVDT